MQECADVHICNGQKVSGRSARNAEGGMRQQLSEFKADFFKALAHPLRISILDALREGELTVNEISQRFDVEQANASQQLAVLRNRNIVVTRKDGANVYYSVSDKSIFKLLDAAKEIFNNHLVGVRSMLQHGLIERITTVALSYGLI